VQRTPIAVRGLVLGHFARGRVQPESQEFDQPVTATVQIGLRLGPVQLEAVLCETGTHGVQKAPGRRPVGRHEHVVIDETVQTSGGPVAADRVVQTGGLQVGQQQVAQRHRQPVTLDDAADHGPPAAVQLHRVAPDASPHDVPDPGQRYRRGLVVEHQRASGEFGHGQSVKILALLAVYGAADLHHVHRVHVQHRRPLPEVLLDPVPDDGLQFGMLEAGERVPEIGAHVVHGQPAVPEPLRRVPAAEELRSGHGPELGRIRA